VINFEEHLIVVCMSLLLKSAVPPLVLIEFADPSCEWRACRINNSAMNRGVHELYNMATVGALLLLNVQNLAREKGFAVVEHFNGRGTGSNLIPHRCGQKT
jgi:hypothetical protein